jgi:hypothetical protein
VRARPAFVAPRRERVGGAGGAAMRGRQPQLGLSSSEPAKASTSSADPRLHPCRCGTFGMFGEGNTWFCREHVPPGFLPHVRGGQ